MATLSLKKKPGAAPAPIQASTPKKQKAAPKGKQPHQQLTPPVDKAAVYAALHRWLPHVFTEPPRPLAVGIKTSLAELPLPPDLPCPLKAALNRWVSRFDYLQACINGEPRIGLDGVLTPIAEREREFAKQRIAGRVP